MIYNVTSKVDHSVHAKWLKWMELAFLPQLLDTNTIDRYQLTRLLGVDETEGPTYALLLTFSSRPAFNIYQEKHLLGHQKLIRENWGEKVLSFPSMLDVVLEGE